MRITFGNFNAIRPSVFKTGESSSSGSQSSLIGSSNECDSFTKSKPKIRYGTGGTAQTPTTTDQNNSLGSTNNSSGTSGSSSSSSTNTNSGGGVDNTASASNGGAITYPYTVNSTKNNDVCYNNRSYIYRSNKGSNSKY